MKGTPLSITCMTTILKTNHMHIALVEDEKKFATVVKTGLEVEGYQVEVFSDGKSAVGACTADPSRFDVIVLDLFLPQLNGFGVCRLLREQQIRTPILILTARDTTEDKVKALDSGADDFMTKPFAFEEFLARIRALLRRTQRPQIEELRVGELILNPALHEARRGALSIVLTVSEYDLLQFLMQRANQVVHRDELIQHLWGSQDPIQSNILDVHIRNLRKKIDDPFPKKYLQTLRGVGYLIKA